MGLSFPRLRFEVWFWGVRVWGRSWEKHEGFRVSGLRCPHVLQCRGRKATVPNSDINPALSRGPSECPLAEPGRVSGSCQKPWRHRAGRRWILHVQLCPEAWAGSSRVTQCECLRSFPAVAGNLQGHGAVCRQSPGRACRISCFNASASWGLAGPTGIIFLLLFSYALCLELQRDDGSALRAQSPKV